MEENDDYNKIMIQAPDRLAEVFAQLMHKKVEDGVIQRMKNS